MMELVITGLIVLWAIVFTINKMRKSLRTHQCSHCSQKNRLSCPMVQSFIKRQ